MGYVYEDEDSVTTTTESENEKSKRKKTKKKSNAEFIVDNLMTAPEKGTKKNITVDEDYTVDNLLDSEESKDIYLKDLLSKKDTKLFDAYLGKNASKITGKNFNFAAFIFGGPYLIYRKVYGIGIFVMLLCLIVAIIFPVVEIKWYVTLLFELIAYIACGIFANQIILNNAASKILNLKIKKEENIKIKLAHIGGTNLLLFFIALLISSGVSSVLTYSTCKELLSSFKSEPTFVKYDGQINANESVNIRTLLDIDVPAGYKTGHADAYQYSFVYMKDANIAIDIVVASRYESADILISDVAKYEGLDDSAIGELPLSNTTWKYISTPLSFYAVGSLNNNTYFIRQMHRGNSEAYLDYPTFLENIQVKE